MTDLSKPFRPLRGWAAENAAKSNCHQGHAFAGDNLKLRRRSAGYIERVCLVCYRDDKRDARAAKRRR